MVPSWVISERPSVCSTSSIIPTNHPVNYTSKGKPIHSKQLCQHIYIYIYLLLSSVGSREWTLWCMRWEGWWPESANVRGSGSFWGRLQELSYSALTQEQCWPGSTSLVSVTHLCERARSYPRGTAPSFARSVHCTRTHNYKYTSIIIYTK